MDRKQGRKNNNRRSGEKGKKRNFKGNRFTSENSTEYTSTSAKKIKNSEELEYNLDPSMNYCIIQFTTVFLTLQQLVKCKDCNGDVNFCLGNNTQNNNESFNSCVWQLAPKHQFSGKKVVDIAAYCAACTFNEGFKAILKIMDVMGITIGPYADQLAQDRDERRIYKANRQSTGDSKEARTARRKAKSAENDDFEKTEGILYGAGIAD